MKDKIMFLIIGILIGAIITAAGFLIYNKCNSSNEEMPSANMEMKGDFQDGQMMGGDFEGDGNEPPEKPDGEMGDFNLM